MFTFIALKKITTLIWCLFSLCLRKQMFIFLVVKIILLLLMHKSLYIWYNCNDCILYRRTNFCYHRYNVTLCECSCLLRMFILIIFCFETKWSKLLFLGIYEKHFWNNNGKLYYRLLIKFFSEWRVDWSYDDSEWNT